MKAISTFRPAYLPDLEFFWFLVQCDHVVFAEHLQYTKGSTISISAPLTEEDLRLTIPVKHQPTVQTIAEKRMVEEDPWQARHLKTIKHQFGDFPFGYFYIPLLEELYARASNRLGTFLYDLSAQLLQWLHFKGEIHRSSSTDRSTDVHEFIQKWYRKVNGDVYLTSEAHFRMGWIDKRKLSDLDVAVRVYDRFPPFHIMETYRSMSILHFLLQFGPEAGYLMGQYRK